ncbi:aldo/keto reductase [Hyphomonas sp.]|uniref:aldo/keto reductase n=1 Tax=Alphaproteobacteria TaxID=28211 RepID=UPI003264A22D
MEKREVGKSGLKIDALGLGCAPLGGNFVDLGYGQAADLIAAAQAAGIGYFDTAPWYGFGRSERVVGDLLRGKDYLLSTKVGRIFEPGAVDNPMDYGMIDPLPFHPVYDYSYAGVLRAFEQSLHRLGLDRVDILLAHDIGTFQHGDENTRYFKDLADGGYRALDELRAGGVVKAIGLGVNENQVCLDALQIGDWDVFLLAGRYTLLEQTPLDHLFPACSKAGTSIICGGPFNSGILVGREMWNYGKAPREVVDKVRAIGAVADAFEIPMAAAALQFPLASDTVTSVIPGPRSSAELHDILRWLDVDIPPAFWDKLRVENLLHADAAVPRAG